ncbi:MAG: hypothetical protein K1X28_02690 [Parachlamydiales bacterium]|nr:hypothetical protein [Parachlamydiales bacterium]
MLEHLIGKISKAKVQKEPFSYFYIENVFPDEFYQEIIEYFPTKDHFQPLSIKGVVRPGTYNQRLSLSLDEEGIGMLPFFHQLFWSRFTEALKSRECISAIQRIFSIERSDIVPDLSLVSDHSDYAIGPHTDHPQKVLTLLFYFPKDDSQKTLGTSVYRPIDPSFRCEGFRHHPFEGFQNIYTAPFVPNSIFGFLKSDRSFHGVEPIGKQEFPRNLMSYQFLTP